MSSSSGDLNQVQSSSRDESSIYSERSGLKRARDSGSFEESSLEGAYHDEDHREHAHPPKRARSSPSNQIHEAIFSCPVPRCGVSYTRRSNLKNHLVTKHADLQPRKTYAEVFRRKPKCKPGQRQTPPLLSTAKLVHCGLEGCTRTFSNEKALADHMKDQHSDEFSAVLSIMAMQSPGQTTSSSGLASAQALSIAPAYEAMVADSRPMPAIAAIQQLNHPFPSQQLPSFSHSFNAVPSISVTPPRPMMSPAVPLHAPRPVFATYNAHPFTTMMDSNVNLAIPFMYSVYPMGRYSPTSASNSPFPSRSPSPMEINERNRQASFSNMEGVEMTNLSHPQ